MPARDPNDLQQPTADVVAELSLRQHAVVAALLRAAKRLAHNGLSGTGRCSLRTTQMLRKELCQTFIPIY
jgi:hypothetical protein